MATLRRLHFASLLPPSMLRKQNIHNSLKFVLSVINIFGLLPVEGVRSSDEKALRFKWSSLKVLYAISTIAISAMGAGLLLFSSFYKFLYIKLGKFVEALGWFLLQILYLNLARKWPELIQEWCQLDDLLKKHYKYPTKMKKRFKFVTVLAFIAAATHNVLFAMKHILRCTSNSNFLKCYLTSRFAQIFVYTGYNLWLGITVQILDSFLIFGLICNDILIACLCAALALKFRQGTVTTDFLRETRENYNRVFLLCNLLNKHVSHIVLLTLTCNFILIINRLADLLRGFESTIERLSFLFALFVLVGRAVLLCLQAARINEESKRPASVLGDLPPALFQYREVQRFLLQISFDDVALSGFGMFKITKGIVLSGFVAVVTYELFVLQMTKFFD